MVVQQKQHVDAVGRRMLVNGLISMLVFDISQIPSRRIIPFAPPAWNIKANRQHAYLYWNYSFRTVRQYGTSDSAVTVSHY